jgi:hypothetical protein
MYDLVLLILSAVKVSVISQTYLSQPKFFNPQEVPLQDILHRPWNGTWQKYRLVPDTITCFYLLLFGIYILPDDSARPFVVAMCVSYHLRALLSALTILPPCNPTYYLTLLERSSSNNGLHIKLDPVEGCHRDLIYSGHVSIMVGVLFHCFYFHLLSDFGLVSLLLLCLCGSLACVTCRCHYTVDVVLAWCMVPMLLCTSYLYYAVQ